MEINWKRNDLCSIKGGDVDWKQIGGNDEKRRYFIFHEKEQKFPTELILTQIPPHYTQPFHRHKTINEFTLALQGEAVGIIKTGSETKEQPIKPLYCYDFKELDFNEITVTEDGTVVILFKNKNTNEIIGEELPYKNGFNAGNSLHTIENRSDGYVMLATVKSTTNKILQENRQIFNEDKFME